MDIHAYNHVIGEECIFFIAYCNDAYIRVHAFRPVTHLGRDIIPENYRHW